MQSKPSVTYNVTNSHNNSFSNVDKSRVYYGSNKEDGKATTPTSLLTSTTQNLQALSSAKHSITFKGHVYGSNIMLGDNSVAHGSKKAIFHATEKSIKPKVDAVSEEAEESEEREASEAREMNSEASPIKRQTGDSTLWDERTTVKSRKSAF